MARVRRSPACSPSSSARAAPSRTSASSAARERRHCPTCCGSRYYDLSSGAPRQGRRPVYGRERGCAVPLIFALVGKEFHTWLRGKLAFLAFALLVTLLSLLVFFLALLILAPDANAAPALF